jgi:hypothetical protein
MIVAQSVSREENPSKPTAACVTFALIPQRKAPRSHEGVAVIAEPTAYFSPTSFGRTICAKWPQLWNSKTDGSLVNSETCFAREPIQER